MNSIRNLFFSSYYKILFTLKLNKILRICRHEVVRSFELTDPKNSYWVDCNKEYACPPRKVEEHKEFNGSLKQQIKTIMKNWQYFATSAQKDFEGLLKYIAWLRNNNSNKKKYYFHQNKVSDHIYEM